MEQSNGSDRRNDVILYIEDVDLNDVDLKNRTISISHPLH